MELVNIGIVAHSAGQHLDSGLESESARSDKK
ncbi:MAG: hypothetical protein RLZZ215_3066, partial [Pseudomonadota bacterium]